MGAVAAWVVGSHTGQVAAAAVAAALIGGTTVVATQQNDPPRTVSSGAAGIEQTAAPGPQERDSAPGAAGGTAARGAGQPGTAPTGPDGAVSGPGAAAPGAGQDDPAQGGDPGQAGPAQGGVASPDPGGAPGGGPGAGNGPPRSGQSSPTPAAPGAVASLTANGAVAPKGLRRDKPGELEFVVRNTGTGAASNLVATVQLPADFSVRSGGSGVGNWRCVGAGTVATCTITSLPADGSDTVKLKVRVGPAAPLSGSVSGTVKADGGIATSIPTTTVEVTAG
jgi:hypothetical protein